MAECKKHGAYVGHCRECEDLADARDILNRTIIPPLSGEGSVGTPTAGDMVLVPREVIYAVVRFLNESGKSTGVALINQLADMLAAAPLPPQEVTDGWQGMESAPRDNTPVLIATDYKAVGEAAYEPERDEWYWAGSHWTDAYDGSVRGNIIAWRPLPAPPESTLRTGEA